MEGVFAPGSAHDHHTQPAHSEPAHSRSTAQHTAHRKQTTGAGQHRGRGGRRSGGRGGGRDGRLGRASDAEAQGQRRWIEGWRREGELFWFLALAPHQAITKTALSWRNILSAAASPLIRLRFAVMTKPAFENKRCKAADATWAARYLRPSLAMWVYRVSLFRHHPRGPLTPSTTLIDFLPFVHRPPVGDDFTGGRRHLRDGRWGSPVVACLLEVLAGGSFIPLPNLTELWEVYECAPSAGQSDLRPRFVYILGHFGHARSLRCASARRGEARLYVSLES